MVDHLLRGHESFLQTGIRPSATFLRQLASRGQSPDALYVGCSDSRVVPEVLTASSPGRLFVVRNVANVLPPLEHADCSVGAALEYAVGELGVPHLIVCGHDHCGGIEALLDASTMERSPSLREWLENVRPAVTRTRRADREAWWRAAVEENVLQQLTHVQSFPIARAAMEEGRLQLHGWVYDLVSLKLRVFDATIGAFRPATDVMGD